MMLAKVIAVIYAVAAIVIGISFSVTDGWIVPLLIAPASAAVVIPTTCWPLYGFGMLIDDVHAMRKGSAAAPVVEEAADELPDL